MHSTTDDHLPLSADEAVEASFGERRGLDPAATGDRNSIVLTDRRLLLLHRNGRRRDVTFVSLLDVGLVEVRRTSRGLSPLWRVALLLAGSGAALATIGYPPLELGLAGLLALAALYHLYRYVDVAEEGMILLHPRAGTGAAHLPGTAGRSGLRLCEPPVQPEAGAAPRARRDAGAALRAVGRAGRVGGRVAVVSGPAGPH